MSGEIPYSVQCGKPNGNGASGSWQIKASSTDGPFRHAFDVYLRPHIAAISAAAIGNQDVVKDR
jgi:hypothetical protein